MAVLSNLISSGAKKALKKATKESVTDSISDISSKALTKSLRNEIADEVTDAAIKKMPKSLSGAGVSSLAPKAGSTLDGILGKSSGIALKNAKKPVARNLADEFADTALAKTAREELADIADRNTALIRGLADDPDNMWFSKRELKGGKVKDLYHGNATARIGATPDTLIPAEYPEVDRMIKEGKLKTAHGTDKFGSGLNEMKNYELTGEPLTYGEKQGLLRAIKDELPEDEAAGLALEAEDAISPDQMRLIDQTYGSPDRKIDVEKITTRKKNVKVSRPEVMEADAVEEAKDAVSPELAQDIADIRAKISSNINPEAQPVGGSIGTAPKEVAGSEGFNVKLKDGKPTTITVGAGSVGSTKQQRAFRKLDDMTAKGLNANAKQYASLMEKSGSIGGHYKTIAERARAEAIDQANIATKAQSALALREDIKQQGLAYAERNGVTINLTGIDNTVGLSTAQKRKLAELGLNLDEMAGGSAVVTPTQAEDIYKTLRDYAYKFEDSTDAATNMAGEALKEEANAVRNAIDEAMDNINVDYKSSLLEMAADNGEDPAYLRSIAGKKDFKFSDLRKDQGDWIAINKLAGNKIKDNPTINVLGIDTGINNPFTAAGDKIKEKVYERQAYGAGGAGAGAGGFGGDNIGGGVPPTGAEGPINFQTAGAPTSTLGSLLQKGKGAGLIGAGVLGGLMLGGGNGGQSDGQTLGDVLNARNAQQSQAGTAGMASQTSSDPYAGMTVGGYTYDELAEGYAIALQAGDASAANSIAKLMGIIEDKATAMLNRQKYESSLKSSTNNNSASAVNVLSNLYDLYNNIQGGKGPIVGNITELLNNITGGGYNTEANTYWKVSRGTLGNMIKGMGDTGALSEGDQKRALEMIPNITDTRAAAEQKFMAIYNILSGAAQM